MIGQSVSCEYFTHIPGLNDYLSTTRQDNTHCYFTRLNLKKKLAAEKKDSKNGAARKCFGPSYFDPALVENFKDKSKKDEFMRCPFAVNVPMCKRCTTTIFAQF